MWVGRTGVGRNVVQPLDLLTLILPPPLGVQTSSTWGAAWASREAWYASVGAGNRARMLSEEECRKGEECIQTPSRTLAWRYASCS